jgi:hypothetical protein
LFVSLFSFECSIVQSLSHSLAPPVWAISVSVRVSAAGLHRAECQAAHDQLLHVLPIQVC